VESRGESAEWPRRAGEAAERPRRVRGESAESPRRVRGESAESLRRVCGESAEGLWRVCGGVFNGHLSKVSSFFSGGTPWKRLQLNYLTNCTRGVDIVIEKYVFRSKF
jgi:hypothetical protein